MISQEELVKVLGNFYSPLDQLSESVFVCERTTEGKVYQKFFFDISDNFLSYDLDSYLKQYVSTFYFKNNNELQWNFYIVFITDQKIEDKDRLIIEENMDYARKFIIHTSEINPWLNRMYLTESNSKSTSTSGLGDIWKSALKENKLDCIFLEEVKIADGVVGIIDGKYIREKASPKRNKNFKESDLNLKQLEWLNPVKYRDYPKFDEPFVFKKINLIDGANGHGKTSLLEAIELLITGENHRIGESDNGYHIEAKFSGDNVPRKFKKDSQLFRERDRIWYNGMDKLRGSDLASHFNKFNFYNTDAAFRLTINKNEKEIEDAFRDIALGDEVNFLRKQISSYQTKLEVEQRLKKGVIKECDDNILEAQLLLTELRKTDGTEGTLIAALYEKIEQYGIQINLIGTDLVSLDRLKFSLTALLSEVENLIREVSWLEQNNLTGLREENIKLQELQNKIADHYDLENQYIRDINETNLQNERIRKSREVLIELAKYFKNNAFETLIGLAEHLWLQQDKSDNLKVVNEMYLPLKSFSFPHLDQYINQINSDNLDKLKEDNEALQQIDSELEKSRKSISQVRALVETIKSQGQKYIELQKEARICPMCESEFNSAAHLQHSLLTTLENDITSEDFSGLLLIKTRLEDSKKATQDLISSINLVTTLAVQLGLQFDVSKSTLGYLKSQIELSLRNLSEEETKLTNLQLFSTKCNTLNLSEQQLTTLRTRFLEFFPDEKLTESVVDKLIDNLLIMYDRNNEKIEDLSRIMKGKNIELLTLIRFYNPHFTIENVDDLRQRFITTQYYLEKFSETQNISFDEDKLFTSLQIETKILAEQVDEIRSDLSLKQKESGISSKANETIIEKSKIRVIALEQKGRIDESLNALEAMLSDHSEDSFLREFLESNKQEISNTFIAIHTPKEFKDIAIKDGKIQLFKKNGEVTNLMRISTGQRSALALSLFLTLNNKLKNGPDILIFDDPVTFTDDLNILSFLDYLRELVINRNKQLFFATANENLSFLFQKKFKLLHEDYKHVTLQRIE
nr:hypothetical protein [uncultured Pedobacter sp.]